MNNTYNKQQDLNMPLGKWIVDKLIAEDKNIKTIVAIYPGRFQPMGAHHAKAYKWLDKKFDDVWRKEKNN